MDLNQYRTSWFGLLAALFILALLLVACGRSTPSPTPTPTPTPAVSPTPFPTRTPTLPPPASEENPLILAVVSETNDPKVLAAAEEIARQAAQITNFQIRARVYPSVPLLLSDMLAAKVHIAFFQPFTYLWARQKGLAEVILLSNHFGVYQIGSQFFANVSSKFTIYYDPVRGLNTTNPAIALKQFDGKRPCWVEPTSASGYIVPLGALQDVGVKVKDGVIAQSPTAVIRALYVSGICDFGATFATTGDPRTSSAVTQDLTDVMNRVVIIYQVDPIIPNLNLSVHSSLPKDMRSDLAFALQNIARSDKGRSALSTAASYEISDFKPVDDSFYDPLRSMLKQSGVVLDTLIGR